MAGWTPPDSDPEAPTAWAPPDSDPEAPEAKSPSEQKLSDLQSHPTFHSQTLDDIGDQVHAAASGMYHGTVGGLKGIGYLLAAKGNDAAADAVNEETAKAYQAPDSAAGRIVQSAYNPLNWSQNAADYLADKSADAGASPGVSTAIKSAPMALAALTGTAGLMRGARGAAAESAASSPALIADKQSIGAAHTLPQLEGTSPEFQSVVHSASVPLNDEAVARHINAETLPQPEGVGPLRLRKGQATRDEQQISDEKNMRADADTQGLLSQSITDQDSKLGSSMQEIRRRATPEIVQRNNAEHGQAAIDEIKDADNQRVLDIRSKYKALADANGGEMPIDTQAVLADINASLKKKPLKKTVTTHPVISDVMDMLGSGEPIDFESFEDMRSALADVQRGSDGAARVAAGIIHNSLNKMPLSEDARGLRNLADTARQVAAERFDIIKKNPAYKAAINDNVDKTADNLHIVGQDSPLADKFMDRYFTGEGPSAAKAYVDRIKGVISKPKFHQAIEAATLNKLRDAAGIDALGNGGFKAASYIKARNALEPKAESLLSPQSVTHTDKLRRAADDVSFEGKSSSINRSNTALTLQRFGATQTHMPSIAGEVAHHVADAAVWHTLGPVAVGVKRFGQSFFAKAREAKEAKALKDAKLKFAQDAVRPGAGIESVPEPTRAPRASGGRTTPTDDELVERLVRRWHAAKRATDQESKPLLSMPDEAIVHALHLSGRNI